MEIDLWESQNSNKNIVMSENEIYETLTPIFRQILSDENIKLSPSSTAAEHSGWDSLAHILLIVEIEKQFSIRFKSKDVQSFRNVGDLVNMIKNQVKS